MKYLKKFQNHSQYESYIASGYTRPNISYCVQESYVHYNPITMADKYLTFTALEDTTFKLTIGSAVSESILSSISYSTDNGKTWNTTNNVDSETVTITTPTINTGNKVLWKGIGTGVSTTINNSNRPSTSSIFSSSGSFNAEGNIMSLIYDDDFSDKKSVQGTYNFALLFYSYNTTDTAKVVSAKDMVLPIKSVPTCGYFRMFQGCTLVEAPSVIEAESIAASGCMSTFWGCENLKTIPKLQATTLGVESCKAMFESCTGLETVTEIPTATSADITSYDNIFNQCTGLTSVTIQNGVTSIGQYAFQNCSGLTSVNIPNSITSIGMFAFSNCSGLTSFEIPSGVTSINAQVFSYCISLTSVTIPDSVTSIDNAFYQCRGLTSVGCAGSGADVEIPDSVTSISNQAFGYCTSLTSVTIPNSVTSLGSYVFYSCSGLTSAIIGGGIIFIQSDTFSNCRNLTSVTISNGIQYISSNTFLNCSKLPSIVLPSSVINLGTNVFKGCSALESITCMATTAPYVWDNTFQNVKTGGTLYVPQGSTGYDKWMGTGNYYLGKYNWTKVEQ